jgi:hypothetical protein
MRRWGGRVEVDIGPRHEIRGQEGSEARWLHSDKIGERVRNLRGWAGSKRGGLNGGEQVANVVIRRREGLP